MGINEIPVLSGGFAPIGTEISVRLTDIEGEVPKNQIGRASCRERV